MLLNLPSYIIRKVSKTSQQSYSRILWRNITATLQQNNIMEFYGRILQQRYSRTVQQQNSVAEYNNVTAGQYCSKILWQNTATLKQSNIVSKMLWQNIAAKCCGRIPQYHSRVQWHCIKMQQQNITTTPQSSTTENILRTLQQKAFKILGHIL